jgi:anti-anti-sigma factor
MILWVLRDFTIEQDVTGRAASQQQGMGSYRYAAAEGSWQWSDGVYAIHGFRRGEVVPSTALLLAHAHSADRRRAAQLLESGLHDGELFSFLYRLIDASGRLRRALITGEGIFGGQGQVTGLHGYLIDVTESQSRARSREAASTVRKAIAARAVIEQAKGALMLVYGLDGEAAFALLSWQSQHANIKLRELAERLVAAVGGDASATAAIRQRLDEIVYSLPAEPVPAGRPDAEDLLAAEQESLGGALLLRLRGGIDMSTGPQLDHYLAAAVAAVTSPAPLVVDLSGVQHLGSVGVALLTSYHRRCQEAGTPLRIVVGAGPAASALAMIPAGLDLRAGVADALASVSKHGLPGPPQGEISYCDWAATPLAGVR